MEKKIFYCTEFCLRNAELMGKLDLLWRCVDAGDTGVSGAREEIKKRAVAATEVDNARIAILWKMARDEMVQVGLARTEQRFRIYRFTLLSRMTA